MGENGGDKKRGEAPRESLNGSSDSSKGGELALASFVPELVVAGHYLLPSCRMDQLLLQSRGKTPLREFAHSLAL